MTDALTLAFANAERSRMACKAATPSVLTSGNALNVPWNLASPGPALEELSHNHGHVYTCVAAIAKRLAGQPIHVANTKGKPRLPGQTCQTGRWLKSHLDPLQPLESHDLLNTIDEPNPIMVRWSLLFSTVASLELTGRAYWWLTKNNADQHQIWPLPPSWMTPMDRMHSRWQVRPFDGGIEPFELDGEDVAYFNLPDPASPFNAISPTRAQGKAISADESLQTSQARMLHNGINPTLAVIIGDQTNIDDHSARPLLDEPQKNQILSSLRKMYGRPEQFGSAIILDALIRDVKKISNNPAEMDFLNSGRMTKGRIFAAYGINPIIVGEVEQANRAQAVVAEDGFCKNVINPLAEMMSQVMTRWVGPRFTTNGRRIVVWIEPCRANDVEMNVKELELGLKWGHVSRDEYRTRVLGFPPAPGGDVFVIPLNCQVVPVGEMPKTDDDDDEGNGAGDLPDDDEDEGGDE